MFLTLKIRKAIKLLFFLYFLPLILPSNKAYKINYVKDNQLDQSSSIRVFLLLFFWSRHHWFSWDGDKQVLICIIKNQSTWHLIMHHFFLFFFYELCWCRHSEAEPRGVRGDSCPPWSAPEFVYNSIILNFDVRKPKLPSTHIRKHVL